MQHDYTTLAGITAAASKLNTEAAAWGLDFDLDIRVDEGTFQVAFWTKESGSYENRWSTSGRIEAETIEAALDDAADWLTGYRLGVKTGLEQAVAALQSENEALRKMLEETRKLEETKKEENHD